MTAIRPQSAAPTNAARMAAAPAPSARAWLLLLLLGAIWGGSFFFVEIGLREVPPLTLVLHRVLWAALALWIYVIVAGKLTVRLTPDLWARWAVMGLLNNAIPFSLIVWGQTEIEGGLASIFNAMTAVFGVLVAAIFVADERLTARKLAGAMIGVGGVALIVGGDALSALDPRSLGQIAVLGATLSYAFASVWGRLRLKGIPVELNAVGMLTTSAIMMAPLAVLVDGPPRFDLSAEVWAAVIGLSVLASAAAYLLYFEILRRAGAANTMLVTLIVPPFAIGLGAAFLDERITSEAWAGFAAIALGLAVIDGRLFRRG